MCRRPRNLTGETNYEFAWLSQRPMSLAPVDLNVAVAVGASRTAALAEALGKSKDGKRYREVFEKLSGAINEYLWDEDKGAYYNFDLVKGARRAGLNVSTFDPLRLGIAPASRRILLLKRMLDPAQFNWGRLPLTSWSMSQPGYVEARGDYDGRAWFGDVWTLRNMTVVSGLEESGRPDLAAELNWSTIKAFNDKYREYLVPSTGEAQGAEAYTWTAAHYIGAIIDHLFGVNYDGIAKLVRVAPHVPKALYNKDLELDNLILPAGDDARLSVHIRQVSPTVATIRVESRGAIPKGDLLVELPGAPQTYRVPLQHSFTADFK